jgi:hypothetical protein
MGVELQSQVDEYCLFNGEQLIADIKFAKHSDFVDRFNIVESYRTFKNGKRIPSFQTSADNVDYRVFNPGKAFTGNGFRPARPPRFMKRNLNPWKNETIVRDFMGSGLKPRNDDVLIFSDIDEIIDSRNLQKVIEFAKEHGVATVKLHFTLYFFNLFSEAFVGPEDYSYRVFIMTGAYYNAMTMTPYSLRKKGEAGELTKEIRCFPSFVGFHHSWIGDAEFVATKLASYSHGQEDHDAGIYDSNSRIDLSAVAELLNGKKSIYGSKHKLSVRTEIPMLGSVEKLRETTLSQYFAIEG